MCGATIARLLTDVDADSGAGNSVHFGTGQQNRTAASSVQRGFASGLKCYK
jgi:hypothetical protein